MKTRLKRCPRCCRKTLFVIRTTATNLTVGWHIDTLYACRCGWRGSVVSARRKEAA